MAIKIVPHTEKYTSAVEEFNTRMSEGGSKWGFYTDPIPDWIPQQEGAKTWREYHLALEDGDTVRGGYALKPQQWLVHGELKWVTDWQGPFTEAAIDVKYSPLMLRLLRGMQKQHPLLFSLGHGGTEEPIVNLLRKMGWDLWPVPFTFRVLKPFKFLRRNRYLRSSLRNRVFLDILAFSGAGLIGNRILQEGIKIVNRHKTVRINTVVVDEFGGWADELWAKNCGAYTCLAVRDKSMMNTLLPKSGWPGGTRLKMTNESHEVIGWSVVHNKQLSDDPRFGNMNVGLITDCFASPENAGAVMKATDTYLTSQNVDMVFANLTHPAWLQGLKACGYTVLENRRIFALAPGLSAALVPVDKIKEGLHLTNMDGHGPHGFD